MILRSMLGREQGYAMVIVVVLAALLSLLALTLLEIVQAEGGRSARAEQRETAFQAAEAGLNDYIAKLVDDRLYYAHNVHVAESTRRPSSGPDVPGGSVWTGNLTWTYPNGADAWKSLPNGYEYNLQITAPTAAAPVVKIVSHGRLAGSTEPGRRIEALIRPSSVADFQMLANADISYGPSATTYGKIYTGIDDSGTAHNVNHDGTAYGDIYAEGAATGSTTFMNGAQRYSSGTIRTVIKNPVNFNSFVSSLVDIQRASQGGGVNLDDLAAANGVTSYDAWRLTFGSGGSFLAQPCLLTGGSHPAAVPPTCSAGWSRPMPANGAIYSDRTVVVSGEVNGRVTVATNGDVVVADDLSYVLSGDDVLGLIARTEVLVALWAPFDLSWRAATIAQGGRWRSWSSSQSLGTMTFTGSTATRDGGYMSMFATRVYQYDDTLVYLPPPWFPTVEEAYTITSFRELPPS